MPDDLRTKLIRLASTMPPKSEARRAIISVLSTKDASGSGPDPYGLNWKGFQVSKTLHWTWENPSKDENIVRMMVIRGQRTVGGQKSNVYWLTIKTRDGVLHKSPNGEVPNKFFQLGAEIYKSGVDPQTLSGWKH